MGSRIFDFHVHVLMSIANGEAGWRRTNATHVFPLTHKRRLTFTGSARVTWAANTRYWFLLSGRASEIPDELLWIKNEHPAWPWDSQFLKKHFI
jgi:hypothetical protein